MRVAGGEDECQLRNCLRSAIGPARFHFRIIMDESVGSIPIEGPRFDVFTCIVNVCQQQGDEVCHCTVESGGVMGGLPLGLLLH